jgi:hypothetical protein
MTRRGVVIVLLVLVVGALFAAGAPSGQAPLRVNPLPDGWSIKQSTSKRSLQLAENSDLSAWFHLCADPASDFNDGVDLQAYAKLIKESVAKHSKLTNRKETELVANQLGQLPTLEYEITGENHGVKAHYKITMFRVGEWYYSLSCWSTPSHWHDARPKFEELLWHLR